MKRIADIAGELLSIKNQIGKQQNELEQLKGQRIAVLDQLKELSLTLRQAESEQLSLQERIEKLDDVLAIKINDFVKTYPELGEKEY